MRFPSGPSLVWRGVYWSKLPGASRKARVAISWPADLLLPPDPLEVSLGSGGGVGRAHFEPGEIVFCQGDLW